MVNMNTLCINVEDDYMSEPDDVSIFAGDTQGLLDITIINDDVVEKTEIFSLTINVTSLPEGIFSGDPSSAVVHILDRDGMYVCYIQIMYVLFSYNFHYTYCCCNKEPNKNSLRE